MRLAKSYIHNLSYDHMIENDPELENETPLVYCALFPDNFQAYVYIAVLLKYGVNPNQQNKHGLTH